MRPRTTIVAQLPAGVLKAPAELDLGSTLPQGLFRQGSGRHLGQRQNKIQHQVVRQRRRVQRLQHLRWMCHANKKKLFLTKIGIKGLWLLLLLPPHQAAVPQVPAVLAAMSVVHVKSTRPATGNRRYAHGLLMLPSALRLALLGSWRHLHEAPSLPRRERTCSPGGGLACQCGHPWT